MKQREYPCIELCHSSKTGLYNLWFSKSYADAFLIENSFDYHDMAARGLKNAFEIKVPFYNEVQA